MKKIIIGVLIAIPVVLIAIALYVSFNLNSLVVKAVETFAPPVTGTEVKLGSSDLSVFSETGSLSNLVIGNPKGYKSPTALKLGSIKVNLNTESLTSDVIAIRSIDIQAPDLTYEPGGVAGSNLQQLQRNIESYTAKTAGTEAKDKGGEGPKVIIDRLTVVDGKINIVTPLSKEAVTAPLPKIELTDIGKDKGGTSPQDALKLVLAKITKSATSTGSAAFTQLKGKLTEEVGKQVEALKDQSGGLSEGLKDQAGGLGDKVKGLFK